MFWDKINEVAKELHELKYNPVEIKSMMKDAVDCAIINLVNNEFKLVIFDSPEGSKSKHILEDMKYATEWIGNIGCRGETKVYLPKDKNVEDFKEWLKDLGLIDEYSVVTLRENYKNTTI